MPKCIIILSGKRKSGKDYVADLLKKQIKQSCSILTLSSPLKLQYAKEHDLDYQRLMTSFDYKEKYRDSMITWGEEKRAKDSGFFARIVTEASEDSDQHVWVISDARRRTDIAYFLENYDPSKIRLLRITAPQEVRVKRGFKFTQGIDDAPSECDLDQYDFEHVLHNDGGSEVTQIAEYAETLKWAEA